MKLVVLAALTVATMMAQKYSGPEPPKADLPFLMHATNLTATEALMAQPEEKKEIRTYVVQGVSSSVKTPMAEPIFLLKTEKLSAEKMMLYRMETKNGRREISFNSRKPKDNPRPIPLAVRRLDHGLYRIEANDSMPNGEYCLSPDGSDQVFCFQVY